MVPKKLATVTVKRHRRTAEERALLMHVDHEYALEWFIQPLVVLVDSLALFIMSCTARVETQPKTHSHQVRTIPRVQGHTLHTQGVLEVCLK